MALLEFLFAEQEFHGLGSIARLLYSISWQKQRARRAAPSIQTPNANKTLGEKYVRAASPV